MRKYSEFVSGEEARKLLLKGAKNVYDAVGITLGARGRNVVLYRNYQTRSLHDGVKVAQMVNPQDFYEAAGAEILKQSAQKQVDACGDGTTVVIILGYAIASEAAKLVSSGVNPMALRSGLERGRDVLIEEIKKL